MYRLVILLVLVGQATLDSVAQQQPTGNLTVKVQNNAIPVEQAEVTIGERTSLTNRAGEAFFDLPPGTTEVRIERYGFKAQAVSATVRVGTSTRIEVELESEAVLSQEITVTATRSDT